MTRVGTGVSVVIPVHNGETYLGEAIASVLGQDLPPDEVVVVDDGSTDGSAALAARFGAPIRCLSQVRAGAAAARNLGVAEACGSLVAFVDADDLWPPDKLATQLPVLAERPEVDVVYGLVQQFISPELPPSVAALLPAPGAPLPAVLPGTTVVRKRAFEQVGPLDATLTVGEFVDWYLRARDAGIHMAAVPTVVLRRRLHRTNQGIVRRDAVSDYLTVVRASLRRRREATSPDPGGPGTRAEDT